MSTQRRRLMVFLFLAAVCAVLVGFYIANRPRAGVRSSPAPVVSQEDMRRAWLSGVARVLADYDRSHDAQAAENVLLALTVPTQDERHINLVIAFHALAANEKNAEALLAVARAAFASEITTP